MAQKHDILTQAENFKEAARKHEADKDAWDKRLKKVVRHKPAGKPK